MKITHCWPLKCFIFLTLQKRVVTEKLVKKVLCFSQRNSELQFFENIYISIISKLSIKGSVFISRIYEFSCAYAVRDRLN